MKKYLKRKNLHLTLFFPSYKEDTLLKEECTIFCGSCAMADIAGLMPLCYQAFAVILEALNFSLWVFCGSEVFFCGYFGAWIFKL